MRLSFSRPIQYNSTRDRGIISSTPERSSLTLDFASYAHATNADDNILINLEKNTLARTRMYIMTYAHLLNKLCLDHATSSSLSVPAYSSNTAWEVDTEHGYARDNFHIEALE